jgi:hypothetical protein
MIRKTVTVLIAIATLSIIACSNDRDEAAKVADGFWTAMKGHDLETARQYVTAESAEFLTMNEESGDQDVEVTLAEPEADGDKITIPTTILAVNEDGSSMDIPMQTVLIKQDGAWKVDAQATMFSIFGGAMGSMMEEMGQAMQESMEELGKSMAEGMQAGMEGAASTWPEDGGE